MKLDPTDQALLQLLQQDARLSYRELARRTGVSTPTAAAKVRALESLGLIRGYRALLDPRAFGQTTHVIDVETRPAAARALAETLGSTDGVEEVLELAGGRLHIRYLASTAMALHAFLAQLGSMPEVARFHAHTVLSGRAAQTSLVGETADVTCHECKGPIHGAGVRKRFAQEGSRDHWFCCRNCAATYEARLIKRAAAATRPRKR